MFLNYGLKRKLKRERQSSESRQVGSQAGHASGTVTDPIGYATFGIYNSINGLGTCN